MLRGCVLKIVGLFLGLLASCWFIESAVAQDPLGNEKRIKDEFNAPGNFSKFETLLSGGTQYTKEDRAISETAAKKFVYQFTWRSTYRGEGKKGFDITSQALHNIFKDKMARAAKGDDGGDNKLFMDVFAKDLIKCVKEALGKYKIDDGESGQVCANIALLLPALGRCKHEEVGDFLTEIVADPKQHALYRFCAVKGLREFFPIYHVIGTEDPTDKRFLLKKNRAYQRVDAVLAYIFQDWKVPANAPKEVRDAVFFQRREGIRTLALAQTPVVEMELDKGGKPVKAWGPAALGLFKILSKEGMAPEASLAERCEAAIGVCQLKANSVESYQSPLAVALIGQLTVDFIEGFNADYPTISNKKIPLLPWRIYGKRLAKALEEFPKLLPRSTDPQKKALGWVTQLREKVSGDFDKINSARGPQPVEPPLELQALVATFQPVSSSVFGDMPGMSIKAAKGK